MEKTLSSKKGFINNLTSLSVQELLLYISIVLMPSFILVSLQAYVNDVIYMISSFCIGIIIGVIGLLLCYYLIPSVLKGRYIPKIVALLSPALLLLSFTIDVNLSTIFYCVFFAAFFLMVYLAFVLPEKNRGKHICAALMLLGMLFAFEYSIYVYDLFSPDSFSYYDISKTIFSDFYNVSTQRQYIVDTDLGISFPYLFPSLMAIINLCTGLEIYSGTVLNLVITCVSCLFLYKISVKYFNNPYAGTIAALFMLTNSPYLTEMRVSRSIPLAILSVLVLAYYVLDLPKMNTKSCIVAGIAAGAAMSCRFDAFIAAGICLLAVFIFTKKGQKIKSTLKYIGGLLIPTTPWILFSFINFGKLWISDNGGTMWLLVPTIPQRYYSSTYTPQTIFTDFGEWFSKLFDYKLKYILQSGFAKSIPVIIGIILLIWFVAVIAKFFYTRHFKEFASQNKKLFVSVGVCLLVYLAKFCGIWLVGYADARYHSESFTMVIFFLAALAYNMYAFQKTKQPANKPSKKAQITKSTLPAYSCDHKAASKSWPINLLTAVACVSMLWYAVEQYLPRYSPMIMSESYLEKPYSATQLEQVVTTKMSDPVVFFCGSKGDPFSFGPYTGLRTFAPPKTRADDPNALIEITDNYIMPDYVVCDPTELRADFSDRYGLVIVAEFTNYSVYEVTDRTTFANERKLFPFD